MHLLLMIPELEQLQRALDNYQPAAAARLAGSPLRRALQNRLQATQIHPGFTRTELCRFSGWHKNTLLKKMTALNLTPPTRRNERLNAIQSCGLLAPWLTILPASISLSPQHPIRLLSLSLPEIDLLRQALTAWPDPTGAGMIRHLTEWLDLLADTRATLPYPLVVADWDNKLQQYKRKELPPNAPLATRRGLFYRTKVAPGVLTLVQPAPRHLDRCHVYTSEVARLNRNTKVLLTAGVVVERYGPASRLLPPVEIAPIDRPAGANPDD